MTKECLYLTKYVDEMEQLAASHPIDVCFDIVDNKYNLSFDELARAMYMHDKCPNIINDDTKAVLNAAVETNLVDKQYEMK